MWPHGKRNEKIQWTTFPSSGQIQLLGPNMKLGFKSSTRGLQS